jgi:hypothetical protein
MPKYTVYFTLLGGFTLDVEAESEKKARAMVSKNWATLLPDTIPDKELIGWLEIDNTGIYSDPAEEESKDA